MSDKTPEQLFLQSRRCLIGGRSLDCQEALASAGKNVTWPVWRWRVVKGWKVQVALTTDYEIPPIKDVADPGRDSLYRGVYYDAGKHRFRARIVKEKKTTHLGHFQDEQLAACAYDIAAIIARGPDAKLNFSEPI